MKLKLSALMIFSVQAFAEPVNINQADAETISRALNGIGPKKAEAIIQYRKEHGDFKTLKDLENVTGIGEKTVKINEKDILLTGASVASGTGEKNVDAAKNADTERKAK